VQRVCAVGVFTCESGATKGLLDGLSALGIKRAWTYWLINSPANLDNQHSAVSGRFGVYTSVKIYIVQCDRCFKSTCCLHH